MSEKGWWYHVGTDGGCGDHVEVGGASPRRGRVAGKLDDRVTSPVTLSTPGLVDGTTRLARGRLVVGPSAPRHVRVTRRVARARPGVGVVGVSTHQRGVGTPSWVL